MTTKSNIGPRIMIVDDEPLIRDMFSDMLQTHYANVFAVPNAAQAVAKLEAGLVDLVVLDVNMPGSSGLDLLHLAERRSWDAMFILVSGKPELNGIVSAMRLRASDFLVKPVKHAVLIEAVARTFTKLVAAREARVYQEALETALEGRTSELEAAISSLEQNYSDTLVSLTTALDAREHTTCSHSFRVRAYTSYLAQLIGYPKKDLKDLEHAALLHDIGKIGIPDSILKKPGRLTPKEFEIMKHHAELGESMLDKVTFLRPAARIVRNHHERYDGAGYPDGLAGSDIPLGARIFVFADTLDAMSSVRCYRASPGLHSVRTEVLQGMGSQFDPEIARAFVEVSDETWASIAQSVESDLSTTLKLHRFPHAPEPSNPYLQILN
jgi:putative nucleotidyltransferase with HDIG domain